MRLEHLQLELRVLLAQQEPLERLVQLVLLLGLVQLVLLLEQLVLAVRTRKW
jgi:hypothetical protein